MSVAHFSAQPMGSEDDVFVAFARIGKQARTKLWGTLQVGIAVLVGLVMFLAIGGHASTWMAWVDAARCINKYASR